MINLIRVDCNDYQEKVLQGFKGGQASRGMFRCENPNCRCDTFYRHGFYDRDVVFISDPESLQEDIEWLKTVAEGSSYRCIKMLILRVKCTGCGTTHSLLPAEAIPFHSFSVIAFLLATLYVIQTNRSDSERLKPVIHETSLLSWPVLIRIVRIFQDYRSRMMAALRLEWLYQSSVDLTDIDLVKSYLDLHPPDGARQAFHHCHKKPLFVHRRNTTSYPLRFIMPEI